MRTKRKEPEIVHRIRPHHGMCLYSFEGKGYSSTFSEHMAEVKEELLQNNGEALLELVTRTDDICSACPHNLNGNCETYGKVNAYDAGGLAYCGLESGQKLSFHELEALVETRILHAGHGREICGDCEWSSICHKG